MFLIVAKYLIPNGFRGMTIFPFVLLKYNHDSKNATIINHEKIHLRQQAELLILPFFIWYFLEFLIRFLQYKNKDLAYRNISFEREAYENEYTLDYLQKRPFFSFISYLKTNKF